MTYEDNNNNNPYEKYPRFKLKHNEYWTNTYNSFELQTCWKCDKPLCYNNWDDCGKTLCFECAEKLKQEVGVVDTS